MDDKGPETMSSGGETNGEKHPLEQGEAGGVPPFNPERALKLQADVKEQIENSSIKEEAADDSNSEDGEMMTLAEGGENNGTDNGSKTEHEKQPTPKEAAEEYMQLLDELSRDFSNPFYRGEEGGYDHAPSSIANQLGREYDLDDPHYRWQGYRGTEAGEGDRTLLRMGAAGAIIESTVRYREAEENVGRQSERLSEIDDKISQLQDSYNRSNKLSQRFNRRRHEKALAGLKRERGAITDNMNSARSNEEFELRVAYGDAKTNPRLDLNGDTSDFRAQFFGDNDPDRAAKVERALELYSKYGDAWRNKEEVLGSTQQISGEVGDAERPEEEMRSQGEQEREEQDREDFERGKEAYEKIEAELVNDLHYCYQAKDIEAGLSSQSRQILSGLEGMVQQAMETSEAVDEFVSRVTDDETVKGRIKQLASRQG